MTFQKIIRSLCMVTFLMMLVSVAIGQVTVYNNFGPGHNGWDYTYTTGWTIAGNNVSAQYGVEQAMGFQSTSDGEVTDIWVAISLVPLSTLPDTVIIRLAQNPSGLPPDTSDIMEEWTLTTFGSWSQWNTPHHLQGNGTSQLQEGQSYWLWAIGKETTWCMWCLNEDPGLTAPHTIRRENENWLPVGNETASAFRVDVTPGTGISTPVAGITQAHSLSQNFPNPFNSTTKISYSIAKPDFVNLKIYDLYGKEIQTLVGEFQDTGNYTIDFDAGHLPTGIYLYKLQAGDQLIDIKKMSYLK